MSFPARARRIVGIAVLLSVGTSAHAGFTVYTDKASFLAATSGAATDSFDDLPASGIYVIQHVGFETPFVRPLGDYAY